MSVVNDTNNSRKKKRRLGNFAEQARPDLTRAEPLRHLGVGIDTARYGHHVSFLREDKELAAPPLAITESREGYQKLQTQLEQLHRRHPEAHIHLRIDAAGGHRPKVGRRSESRSLRPLARLSADHGQRRRAEA